MTEQKSRNKSPLSLEIKKKLLPARFSSYVACTINCDSESICLRACLHKCDHVGVIGNTYYCLLKIIKFQN